MYNSMKILVNKQFYATADQAQLKLDIFFAVNRLTGDEYTELSALIAQVYNTNAE